MRRDDWLLAQLPVGMSEDDFLRRFLQIFQDLSDTVLDQVDVLDRAFDPTVAPGPMVRSMGGWIGLDWVDSSLDDITQREAVMTYASMLQWRGTRRGLISLLRLLSGTDDVTVEDSGGVFAEGEAPHDAPRVELAMASAGWAHPDDIVRIVRSELPAGVTFELRVGGELVWPRDDHEDEDDEQRANQEVN